MRICQGYFTWVAPPRIGEVVHPRLGTVVRKQLTTTRAEALWRQRFENLHITAEGAKALFGHLATRELGLLLEACKTDAERALIVALGTPAAPAVEPAPEPATDIHNEEEPTASPAPGSRRGRRGRTTPEEAPPPAE